MKQAYGKLGVQVMSATAEAMFKRRPFFIVERRTPQGNGESYSLFLKLPGEWTEVEADAMRFPQRVLAESYARRFKGVVAERAP